MKAVTTREHVAAAMADAVNGSDGAWNALPEAAQIHWLHVADRLFHGLAMRQYIVLHVDETS